MLRYLSRYTHRVAISNRRLIADDDAAGVAFRWKDYRIEGPGRWKTMRLHPHEFIRRFLMHLLPRGFHRIRQLQARIHCFYTCFLKTQANQPTSEPTFCAEAR